MIIGSLTPPPPTGWIFKNPSPEVVPQIPSELSTGDEWNNLNALLALYKKTENYDVFSVQVSRPGMELNRSYILEQIKFLLSNAKHNG